MSWKLKHPKQCETCPWRQDATVDDIPNYDRQLHEGLNETIADPSDPYGSFLERQNLLRNMACHYSSEKDKRVCIGWAHNQLTVGNNMALRLRFRDCENSGDLEIVGEQKQTFRETFQ